MQKRSESGSTHSNSGNKTKSISYDLITCPNPVCGEQVKKVHMYCGYCHQQLLIKCPRCGIVTPYGHKYCPEMDCGVKLHEAYLGLTVTQEKLLRRQLQGLMQKKAELMDDISESRRYLKNFLGEEKLVVIRLAIIGVSFLLVLIGVGSLIQLYLSLDIWSKIWMLLLVVVFQTAIWFCGRLLLRLIRWESIGTFIQVRQERTKEQDLLTSLEDTLEDTLEEIAKLENRLNVSNEVTQKPTLAVSIPAVKSLDSMEIEEPEKVSKA